MQTNNVLSRRIKCSGEFEGFLFKNGFRYVGEVGFCDWKNFDRISNSDYGRKGVLIDWLKKMGLPFPFQVQGWVPPYWSDENFLSVLSLPLHVFFEVNIETRPFHLSTKERIVQSQYSLGKWYVGTWLKDFHSRRFTNLRYLQTEINRGSDSYRHVLHGAMILPPDWQASKERPPDISDVFP